MDENILLKSIICCLAFAMLIHLSCAKQVGLTGGPKDTDPPQVLYSVPENGSINFNTDRIRIYFDEYIRLNNLNQKLIISPPIEPKPDIILRGKSIQISLDPTVLEENTTYSLNFNDAIADNNENNVLHSFIYAFSTGPYIDSLQVSGKVLDAYTRKPSKDAYVLLHNNLSDTAFRTMPPVYLTKVNDKGEFKIPFIKEGTYNIFALEDANYNYKFDLAEEPIAFLDSVIVPSVIKVEPVLDTVVETDINETQDTVSRIRDFKRTQQIRHRFIPDNIQLLLFTEDYETQYIKDRSRKRKENIKVIFNRKQLYDFNIRVKGDDNPIIIHNEAPDTVSIWLQNKDVMNSDTVKLYIDYFSAQKPDSIIIDTLRISSRDIRKEIDSVLIFSADKQKHPTKNYKFTASAPLKSFDKNLSEISIKNDTIYERIDYKLEIDSLNPLILYFHADFKEQEKYRIVIKDDFATDIYGLSNLADTVEFSVISSETFGSLTLNLTDADNSYIAILLKNDNEIYQKYSDDGVINFTFIKPDTYRIKLIKDKNQNQRWDTGNYKKKIQPEPIMLYPGEVEIRANWNHEIEWDIIDKTKSEE